MKAPSTACTECRNLLGGYVLGALEPQEAERVRAHLAACADCAAEYEELAGLPSMLDGAGSIDSAIEPPPATLEEAVLDRFAREHPAHSHSQEPRMPFWDWLGAARARLARPLPAAAVGALAATAAAVVLLLVLPGSTQREAPNGETYAATLTGSRAAPRATAAARLVGFPTGTRVHLNVSGLRSSPDTVYELWCVRDDGFKVSAGTFRVDAGGRANVDLSTAAIIGEYHRLSIERRQSAAAPSGRPVMAGDIRYVPS